MPSRPVRTPESAWKPNTEDAKRKFLEYIAAGDTNVSASAKVGRTDKGIEYWRKQDPTFRSEMDFVRARRQGFLDKKVVPDFPEFCAEYLGLELHLHQLQWFDLLEGRPPRDLHPSMTYIPGRANRILINTPPNHAKSTTITMAYVVWRICKNPNEHIVIVSASQDMAKKFLKSIKTRLSHPTWRKLQQAFGPVEGWQKTASTWTTTQIGLIAEESDGEKDPTVQALGVGGQIYGARASLIVLDDVVDLRNVRGFEDQITWLTQEVINRPGQMSGSIVIVGTRIAAVDFYSELLSRFDVYTYLAQPAVLEYGETYHDWTVLWPEREDTSAEALYYTRDETPPTSWARAYQQQTVSDDAIFPLANVQACVNGLRTRGLMVDGYPGHRKGGMDGLTVIAGLDPATTGFTAAVVLGIDRKTKMRYLLDCFNEKDTSPAGMRAMIHKFTERYGISEWRVERNAFQRFLTQDEELRMWLHTRGCVLREHYTHGVNKWDADYGVQSMETLFSDSLTGGGLIELPDPKRGGATSQLIEQLISWSPKTTGKTDLVMALWFTEIKARELTRPGGDGPRFGSSKWMSRRGKSNQVVVDLEALAQEAQYRDHLSA